MKSNHQYPRQRWHRSQKGRYGRSNITNTSFKVSKSSSRNAGSYYWCAISFIFILQRKYIITRRNYLNIIIPNFNFNRPEYKIPGLYVIDSIVRQSRHQFGPDKDVFAPRFAKNIQLTFYHLYKCSEEEKVYISLVSFLIFLKFVSRIPAIY